MNNFNIDTNYIINHFPDTLLLQMFDVNVGVARQINKRLCAVVNAQFETINNEMAKADENLQKILTDNKMKKTPIDITKLMYDYINSGVEKEGFFLYGSTLSNIDRINWAYKDLKRIPQILQTQVKKDLDIKANDFTYFVSSIEILDDDTIHLISRSVFDRCLDQNIQQKAKNRNKNDNEEKSRHPEDLKDWRVAAKYFRTLSFYTTNYKMHYLPQEIGELTRLQSLDLDGHKLSYLPRQLAKLKLKKLYVANNPFIKFPTTIIAIPTLKKLSLAFCNLKELPGEIDKLIKLKELDLHGNHLKKLPPTLTNLKHLKFLDIGNNPLQSFPAELEELPQLNQLNIQIEGITISDLPKKILENSNLCVTGKNWEKPSSLKSWKKAKNKLKKMAKKI